eukprot:gene25101-66554_t
MCSHCVFDDHICVNDNYLASAREELSPTAVLRHRRDASSALSRPGDLIPPEHEHREDIEKAPRGRYEVVRPSSAADRALLIMWCVVTVLMAPACVTAAAAQHGHRWAASLRSSGQLTLQQPQHAPRSFEDALTSHTMCATFHLAPQPVFVVCVHAGVLAVVMNIAVRELGSHGKTERDLRSESGIGAKVKTGLIFWQPAASVLATVTAFAAIHAA